MLKFSELEELIWPQERSMGEKESERQSEEARAARTGKGGGED